ncbi:MAG: FAD-dependent oxidoreductase [Gammaproteobacteria bacterium]|nr:FAD-dependent oxidoreductase [Gammaproteobacteria bacterium]
MSQALGKTKQQKKVIIVGAGWAGLAAAVELSDKNYQVQIIESARQVGGRARSVPNEPHTLDNGQHILLGAYLHTLTLCRKLQLKDSQLFLRSRLKLRMLSQKPVGFSLSAPFLPAPLHLLFALLFAHGLSFKDKCSTIWRTKKLLAIKLNESNDITVKQLLNKLVMPKSAIEKFLEPLCIAALNTPIETASARIFINSFRLAFTGKRRYSDLLIPLKPLSEMLPEPAIAYIKNRGAEVLLGTKVNGIVIKYDVASGVQIDDAAGVLKADHVIIATGHHQASRLLEPHHELEPVAKNLERMTDEPICTVYLRYDISLNIDQPIQGLLDSTGQWLFDRTICGQEGQISVVISAGGPHMKLDNDTLIQTVIDEIVHFYPWLNQPIERKVIREKRATFHCSPENNLLRPGNGMATEKLWLAGDYTATNLPGTLEGAVLSGRQCALKIIQYDKIQRPRYKRLNEARQ